MVKWLELGSGQCESSQILGHAFLSGKRNPPNPPTPTPDPNWRLTGADHAGLHVSLPGFVKDQVLPNPCLELVHHHLDTRGRQHGADGRQTECRVSGRGGGGPSMSAGGGGVEGTPQGVAEAVDVASSSSCCRMRPSSKGGQSKTGRRAYLHVHDLQDLDNAKPSALTLYPDRQTLIRTPNLQVLDVLVAERQLGLHGPLDRDEALHQRRLLLQLDGLAICGPDRKADSTGLA